jgi:hypothetical protein
MGFRANRKGEISMTQTFEVSGRHYPNDPWLVERLLGAKLCRIIRAHASGKLFRSQRPAVCSRAAPRYWPRDCTLPAFGLTDIHPAIESSRYRLGCPASHRRRRS